jgi:hypothetical protein
MVTEKAGVDSYYFMLRQQTQHHAQPEIRSRQGNLYRTDEAGRRAVGELLARHARELGFGL